MEDKPQFRLDLYQGSAGYYDRYRLGYPEVMLAELTRRAEVSGVGRLLDLACGTGQLAFPLRHWFREVWAVDQEGDMVELVRAKAAAEGTEEIRPVVSSAEELDAELGYFEMVVIGNAFHRLDRDLVAARILGWLKPGGHLALCWSSSPWKGAEDWQQVFSATVDKWQEKLGAADRVPAGWNLPRERRPDTQVISEAGFEVLERGEFAVEHRWTLPELAGHVRSTSFLPASTLGDRGAAFDADLEASLSPYSRDGAFIQSVSYAYDLARKPGA